MTPTPQFTATLEFHFREHGPERRHWFMFGDDLHRRVPMQMEGVEGLHTVGMWVDSAETIKAGDSVQVRCVVIAPEIFRPVVRPGVKFELWDGGFLATGTVIERVEKGWPSEV
jgi:hypothetical protein